jgi:hypothetical protein
MASMGDMPDTVWNIMSLCSCHFFSNKAFFDPKKRNRPFRGVRIDIISFQINHFPWPGSIWSTSFGHLEPFGTTPFVFYDPICISMKYFEIPFVV